MRHRTAALALGFAAIAAGCTTASGTPATAPSVPETVVTTTTTLIATTTVAPATTTTVDRLSEIQAIYEELELRRLQAIYDQDEAAFRSLYANEEYLEADIEAFDAVKVIDPVALSVSVVRIVRDETSCIAADVQIEAESAFEGGATHAATIVLERIDVGWGYSWVGEDWECVGPHPLSG